MSKIKISELSPVGLKLFQDSENFLNELTDSEMKPIMGGATFCLSATQGGIPLSPGRISPCQTAGITLSVSAFD